MKLWAYIALLEAIRDSEDEDLDLFVGHSDGKPDRGLKDAKEPATPEVVTLLKEDGRGAAMFVANESKFRGTFTDTYEDAGHAVRLA